MRKITILIFFCFSILFFVPVESQSAACILKKAEWSKTRAGNSESVGFKIMADNCSGWDAAINIWEKDRGKTSGIDSDDLFESRTRKFDNSGVINDSWIVDLSKSGADNTGDNEFYIETQAGSGAGSKIESGILYVWAGGEGTGGLQIVEFSISPTSMKANSIEKINYIYHLKIARPAELKNFCGSNPFWGVRETISKKLIRNGQFEPSKTDYSFDFSQNYQSGNSSVQFEAYIVCRTNNIATSSPLTLGVGTNSGGGGGAGGGSDGGSGQTSGYAFEVPNFIKGGPQTILDLIAVILDWLIKIAIPIAVIMIIYGGILFLFAGQSPALVTKGRKIVTYAMLGLAVIFIGGGFITLIQSALESAGGSPKQINTKPSNNGPLP